MTARQRKFAYGNWTQYYEGTDVSCPIATALGDLMVPDSIGEATNGSLDQVMSRYDTNVIAALDADNIPEVGVVNERIAKAAWLAAIKNSTDDEERKAGRIIAKMLGWV